MPFKYFYKYYNKYNKKNLLILFLLFDKFIFFNRDAQFINDKFNFIIKTIIHQHCLLLTIPLKIFLK